MTDAPPLAVSLGLAPHPEGGWFRRTWASRVEVTPVSYTHLTLPTIYSV